MSKYLYLIQYSTSWIQRISSYKRGKNQRFLTITML